VGAGTLLGMALDPSFVGRSYPSSEPYQVSREKIREFAAAIGATEAAHHDPAAAVALGYADLVAPPTFPVVISMAANQALIDDPALGLDFSRVVHGDQRFAYVRPVQAGDRLVAVSTVEEILSRGGHDFLTTRTEIATDAGEPVVTVWSRLVVRGEG
jgi:acyl dehydratase